MIMAIAKNSNNKNNFEKQSFDKIKDFLRKTDKSKEELDLSDKLLALSYIEKLEEDLQKAKLDIAKYKKFFATLRSFIPDDYDYITTKY